MPVNTDLDQRGERRGRHLGSSDLASGHIRQLRGDTGGDMRQISGQIVTSGDTSNIVKTALQDSLN